MKYNLGIWREQVKRKFVDIMFIIKTKITLSYVCNRGCIVSLKIIILLLYLNFQPVAYFDFTNTISSLSKVIDYFVAKLEIKLIFHIYETLIKFLSNISFEWRTNCSLWPFCTPSFKYLQFIRVFLFIAQNDKDP